MSGEDPKAVFAELWPRLLRAGIDDPLTAVEQVGYLMLLKRFELEGIDAESAIPQLIELGGRCLEPLRGGKFSIDAATSHECLVALDRLSTARGRGSSDGEIFEALLEHAQAAVRGGEFRTPPAVAALMADLAAPMAGDRVCDLAAGTGGLLVQASQRVRLEDEAGEMGGSVFRGYDVDPGLVRICALNLFFHDVQGGRAEQANVLAPEFTAGGFDVVLCAPPFGAAGPRLDINPRLARAGQRLDLQFVELCRQLPWRTSALLVPEAFLFGRTPPFMDVRKEWLQQHSLVAVILLPPTVFKSYDNVRTAILLTSSHGVTDTVWFCPVGEGHSDEERLAAELAAVPEAVKAKREGRSAAGETAAALARDMFRATIGQIESFGWSLSPGFHRPPKDKEPGPRALDLVRELEVEDKKISEHLQQARELLEQLR